MIYSSVLVAIAAATSAGERFAEKASFKAFASMGCRRYSVQGLSDLISIEVSALDAEPLDSKAISDRTLKFLSDELMHYFSYLPMDDGIGDLVCGLRQLPASITMVLPEHLSDSARAEYLKSCFKGCIRKALANTPVLELSVEDLDALLSYALVCVYEAVTGRAGTPCPEELAEAAPLMSRVGHILYTHDSKLFNAFGAARAQLPTTATASKFLSAAAFEPRWTFRVSSGSVIGTATWVADLLSLKLKVPGIRVFEIHELFCPNGLAVALVNLGSKVAHQIPLAESQPVLCRKNVSEIEFKVDSDVRTLTLLPNASMLKAAIDLAEKVASRRQALKVAATVEALEELAAFERLSEKDQLAIRAGKPLEGALAKSVLKAVNASTSDPRAKLGFLPKSLRNAAGHLRPPVALIPVVGSQPQSCGTAYLNYCGSKGVPRFYGAPKSPEFGIPAVERRYYSLERRFEHKVFVLKDRLRNSGNPLESLHYGSKWVGASVQQRILEGYGKKIAHHYLALLLELRKWLDADVSELKNPPVTALAKFCLGQSLAVDELIILAGFAAHAIPLPDTTVKQAVLTHVHALLRDVI